MFDMPKPEAGTGMKMNLISHEQPLCTPSLSESFFKANVHPNDPGILIKCKFGLSEPRERSEIPYL